MTRTPIVLVYHCVFAIDGKLLPAAPAIVASQMQRFQDTGLLDAASRFIVGVNGSSESRCLVASLIPRNARVVYHGSECRTENRTIVEIEKCVKSLRGEAFIAYAHCKGATWPPGDRRTAIWRGCMMRHMVTNWRRCVSDLASGYQAAGCHWMAPPLTPPGQHIFAGTFFWARASYLATLPPISSRARIRMSGIDSLESRFEAEVWIGNGPRLPLVKDYHGPWHPGNIASCE